MCKTPLTGAQVGALQVNFMMQSMVEKRFGPQIAERQREHDEAERRKKEEAEQRAKELRECVPIIFSKAHVFPGMHAQVNLGHGSKRVCKKLI